MKKNWHKILLSPEQTLLEALSVINNGALRTGLVVDNHNTLLGMITDGDIRRALLNKAPLQEKVAAVMNPHPVVVAESVPRQQRQELMRARSILTLPVVDNAQRLTDLEIWQDVNPQAQYENPVFIMAGGLGSRLRPLTNDCPKPMLKVGDKPMLEIMLRQFINAGFRNIYISTCYMAEKITRYFGDGSAWGVNIRYVHEDKPLGTAGALGLLPEGVQKLPLIMINGDVLTDIDFSRLLNFHQEHNPVATLCVRQYDYQIPYGVINSDGNRIVDITEKPVQHFFVNAGIYVLSPELFLNVPKNEKVDMPCLLERHIAASDQVLMYPLHEYWLDIGQIDDFRKAQQDIKEWV
ncbi:TPA: nucleotidyltransferase family protein [Citrobacter sedlakii]|nr:nucleotidyltransferase family protein [Citrobacter sedlakii]EKX8507934.1 nucleotidyltransferase family protein [Citrobacter sedlakii]HCA7077532.1 nucleotidyltransferase family protein [Citrobacter sedlakii]HCA7081555.1 nucleotidyltransferase family protein [Citrobacter sedlakii]HCA7134875.1 nucleotidyltransferase family protein [Citrobacter sedlakii]